LALAEELGDFLDYIGGPSYGYLLMNSFETLCAVEETVVREKVSLIMRQ
jgi:serine/threonine-protein phosphatase 2A regulatory subunit A